MNFSIIPWKLLLNPVGVYFALRHVFVTSLLLHRGNNGIIVKRRSWMYAEDLEMNL